ncbi:tetratricopeptide repeat protein [Nitrolancea hollandica]|uniref:Tetratricopeptide TPR_2 repeat protein n=1 Tax=Nitrolancea hollandica Lb TaxID=1129897 RepID=I4EJE9_9BACT|nr:tetratricopeptide repeat protein [Nitrolancea hollandica]CCF84811.1 Tetratricopeptide TPR_2 repeat protein [Nitrolancea hollandica Lb]
MRRQVEEARRLAVQGKWEQAVEANRQIIEQSKRDVEAYNRLGRALLELGRLDEALEAYNNALAIDPANVIAQRSITRIDQIRQETQAKAETARPGGRVRAGVFVEEAGKTYVTDLVRPASSVVLSRLVAADEVQLRVEANQVQIYSEQGTYLGQLEPKVAQPLMALINAGNRYEAFVVALTGNTVRVILREVFRNPEAPKTLSLPRQAKVSMPRPYFREPVPGRAARELEAELLEAEELEEENEEELEEGEALEPSEEEEEFLDDADRPDGDDDDDAALES